jgi:hypothetical protein
MMSMDRESAVAAVFFGSAWGIVEALLGGFMHMVLPFFPYTGALVISLVVPLVLVAKTHGRGTVLLTGFVAASFKLLNFVIFPSMSIIRPMVAIIIEAAVAEMLLYAVPRARGAISGFTLALASALSLIIPPSNMVPSRILLSVVIASVLSEGTTRAVSLERVKPNARVASALFTTAMILTLLI